MIKFLAPLVFGLIVHSVAHAATKEITFECQGKIHIRADTTCELRSYGTNEPYNRTDYHHKDTEVHIRKKITLVDNKPTEFIINNRDQENIFAPEIRKKYKPGFLEKHNCKTDFRGPEIPVKIKQDEAKKEFTIKIDRISTVFKKGYAPINIDLGSAQYGYLECRIL